MRRQVLHGDAPVHHQCVIVWRHGWIERASRGDQDAFARLATANADRSYALAYRILRDPQRAEDAAQQAFLGAWRDLPTLNEPRRFDAWLRRLVVHACYAEARRDRRWTAHVRLISTEPQLDPDTPVSVATLDELERGFRGCHRNGERWSCSITTSGLRT